MHLITLELIGQHFRKNYRYGSLGMASINILQKFKLLWKEALVGRTTT